MNAGNGGSLRFGTGSFTVLAWVKPAATGGYQAIAGSWNGAPNDRGYILGTNAGKDNPYIDSQSLSGASTLIAGNWYHLALVRNGDTASIYVNGAQDASSPGFAASNASFFTALNLGGTPNGNDLFNGIIDDVAIFNRALSA
ncbi:LamG domain-containing protein [Candidatus Micrarchaeota archaeon]|nr:LamG domain-containing protein [Candidatus Micrarchaeota archaeon]